MASRKTIYLASTGGGNDLRSHLRALLSVALAILAVLLTILFLPAAAAAGDGFALLPALAGALAILIGHFAIARRLIPERGSHYLLFEGIDLTMHSAEGTHRTFQNRKLKIECAGTSNHARAVTVKGERLALSRAYVQIDKAQFTELCGTGKGVRFRLPLVQIRADADERSLRAVRIRSVGRYRSREELIC